jgi:hypothetical protein
MIHLYKSLYLLPPHSSNTIELINEKNREIISTSSASHILENLLNKNISMRLQGGMDFFYECLKFHWTNILQDSSTNNLDYLIKSLSIDLQLKRMAPVSRPSWDMVTISEKTFVIKPEFLSFENILASYLMWPDLVMPVIKKKLEYFCWEQIIQEISVIRQEVNLLVYNHKINRFLPSEFQIDHNEDIEIQLYNNPFLSWLFDSEYRFSNIEYFKRSIDLVPITHFYDSWMLVRAFSDNEKVDHSFDNLKWITEAIKKGDWIALLNANLQRNFGCVYLDNTMIEKGNQVWASALLRDHAKGTLETAKRLCLKPELFKVLKP